MMIEILGQNESVDLTTCNGVSVKDNNLFIKEDNSQGCKKYTYKTHGEALSAMDEVLSRFCPYFGKTDRCSNDVQIKLLIQTGKWIDISNVDVIPNIGETVVYNSTVYKVERVSHDFDNGIISVILKEHGTEYGRE